MGSKGRRLLDGHSLGQVGPQNIQELTQIKPWWFIAICRGPFLLHAPFCPHWAKQTNAHSLPTNGQLFS